MILKTEHYPERGIMYDVNRGVNQDGSKKNHAKVRFEHPDTGILLQVNIACSFWDIYVGEI